MKKLLITGAGGFLGSHLIERAKGKYDLFGISKHSKINLPTEKSFYLNIEDQKELIEVLDNIQAELVIHCAAISGESGCRLDEEKAKRINVISTITIANWCSANNARMIFTSSDLVLDGENPPYCEQVTTKPLMKYGQLKLEAEIALKNNIEKVCIVRLPLLYGIGIVEKKGILNQFIENIKARKEQNLFSDEYRTPVFVEDVSTFLIELLAIDFNGVLNLGGKERVSRYELGELFCECLDLDKSLLKAITRSDINMEFRPKDTSMKSDLAYSLGFQPKNIRVALRQIQHAIK